LPRAPNWITIAITGNNLMQPHVLYQIPMATGPLRLVMICVCLLFVVPIYFWWLPRLIKYARDKASTRNFAVFAILFLPTLIGIGPLLVLIALIVNPTTWITDTGIISQSVFSTKPQSFTWSDINRVDCHGTRNGQRLRSITITGPQGQTVEIGNASGIDIYSVRDLLENQLGPTLIHHCSQLGP
jgi:hypothetical protein